MDYVLIGLGLLQWFQHHGPGSFSRSPALRHPPTPQHDRFCTPGKINRRHHCRLNDTGLQ